MSTPHYCLGFFLSPGKTKVVLISKTKPAWQAGLLNGVGGKVEHGEAALDAMVREFEEETGHYIGPDRWTEFTTLRSVDTFQVDCFVAQASDEEEFAAPHRTTDEEVLRVRVSDLYDYDMIENLRWLVPMAADLIDSDGCVFAAVEYV